MESQNGTRIDKWLWAVRLYKTRSLAAEACKLGKVICNGVKVKPSKEIKQGEVYEVNIDQLHRRVRVIGLLGNRVGAKDVAKYMEDLTSEEEYERIKTARSAAFELRDRHTGRPTKRDRRLIEDFKFGE